MQLRSVNLAHRTIHRRIQSPGGHLLTLRPRSWGDLVHSIVNPLSPVAYELSGGQDSAIFLPSGTSFSSVEVCIYTGSPASLHGLS